MKDFEVFAFTLISYPKSRIFFGKYLTFPLAIRFIFDVYAMAIKIICGESGILYRFFNLTLKYDALTSTILM